MVLFSHDAHCKNEAIIHLEISGGPVSGGVQVSIKRDKKKIPTVSGGLDQPRVGTRVYVRRFSHDGDCSSSLVQTDADKMVVACSRIRIRNERTKSKTNFPRIFNSVQSN